MSLRTGSVFAWSIALLGFASCRDLPVIEGGVCGNGVVERNAGEDCDLFANAKDSECAAPGQPQECRYTCALRDDGSRPSCPGGMLCALDGVCRWPSGHFEKSTTVIAASPRQLLVGDIDGDRRQDLVVGERDRSVVHYFADQATENAELVIPNLNFSGTAPVVGELSGDGLPDVLVPYAQGIVASLGSPGRELLPTAYPTLALPKGIDEAYYVAADVLPDAPGQESLILAGGASSAAGVLVLLDAKFAVHTVTLSFAPHLLARDILVGNIFEDPLTSPCDDLLLPFKGSQQLYSFTPCTRDANQAVVINVNGGANAITLPNGDIVLGPSLLADLDHDGHLDAAVVASNGDQHFIDVAHGLGDGTFDSSSPPKATADGKAARMAALGKTTPFAIADFDSDGAVDYVDDHGAYAERASGWLLVGSSGSDAWSDALVADLNGNGIPDVFAPIANASGAHFLNGAGDGSFSEFDVASEGELSHLRVGDYDGDLILDLAAAEASPEGFGDFVSICFGRPSGGPNPAQRMGLVGEVLELATARASPLDGPQWASDDLTAFTLSSDKTKAFAGFGGRGDRELRAAFVPLVTTGVLIGIAGTRPYRLAAGQFDDDGHSDVVDLSLSDDQSGHIDARLWLLPMKNEAQIPLSGIRVGGALPATGDFEHAEMAVGDLDRDSIDEVVILAPDANGTGSHGYVARSSVGSDGQRSFVVDSGTLLLWRFREVEGLDLQPGDPGGGRMALADLDADGDLDVIALAPHLDKAPGALVEFPGDGSAKLGAPAELPPTPDGPPTAFALIQADEDPAIELALLANSRVYMADADAKGRYHVATAPVGELAGATLIASGDFDGDGVPDLALGTPSGFGVLRGVPGIP